MRAGSRIIEANIVRDGSVFRLIERDKNRRNCGSIETVDGSETADTGDMTVIYTTTTC